MPCREEDLGWRAPSETAGSYVMQDLERLGAFAYQVGGVEAFGHDGRVKILKRQAVAFRTTKGSSLAPSLQLRDTVASDPNLSAAAMGIVTVGAPKFVVAGPGVEAINSINDVYEHKTVEWGETEGDVESERRLTANEKSDLALTE